MPVPAARLLLAAVLVGGAFASPALLAQPPADPLTGALDSDGDGEISAAELEQAVAALHKLDLNGDGKLAGDELVPEFGGPGFGPGFGPGGPGFGGPGGPMGATIKLVKDFDKDGDRRLNDEERRAARASLAEGAGSGRRRGFGGPGFGRNAEPPAPGKKVAPADVASYPDRDLYDTTVLRTIFIDFANQTDWYEELSEFKPTDVEVPATLTVDGKSYPGVGVRFRGMSSFGMVPEGYKKSLDLSIDYVDSKQNLYGYRTLNLLNGNGDASLMSSLLYSHMARQYIAAPKVNFVNVVINGEYWGVFVNAQQFDADFLEENYRSKKGFRWKVKGNPGADGGLRYLGEDFEPYRERFQLKSKDSDEAWKKLIALCRTLDETPAEQLEEALAPIMDVDGLLWFLALDVALVNSDGYWTRASDYSIYLDGDNKFHFIPHDMNEAFHGLSPRGPGGRGRGPGPGGPGFPGDGFPGGGLGGRGFGGRGPEEGFGPGGRGGRRGPGGFGGRMNEGSIELEPLVSIDNPRMPLRSKVLAVPALRTRYLQHVRTIAEVSMDWGNVGSLVNQSRALIEEYVEADTRKTSTFEEFQTATSDREDAPADAMSIRAYLKKRREFLLTRPEIVALPASDAPTAE